VVVYVHGGGYCIGSLDSHRSMLTHLASAVDGRVLAVDYRLAPEFPFPAALDDACAAYRWVLGGGTDPSRVVVAGDSAGGGLTLAALIGLRDAGDTLPAAGVCLSPWADLTQSGATISEMADVDPMVNVEDLGRWAAAYAGSDHDPGSPGLSPLFADLSGLPPLQVEVGRAEVLLDDARRLAERARAAGVEVTLFEGEDLIHVWHFFAGAVPEADDGIARVACFITERAG
jgi:acetyl esterase/lipase